MHHTALQMLLARHKVQITRPISMHVRAHYLRVCLDHGLLVDCGLQHNSRQKQSVFDAYFRAIKCSRCISYPKKVYSTAKPLKSTSSVSVDQQASKKLESMPTWSGERSAGEPPGTLSWRVVAQARRRRAAASSSWSGRAGLCRLASVARAPCSSSIRTFRLAG